MERSSGHEYELIMAYARLRTKETRPAPRARYKRSMRFEMEFSLFCLLCGTMLLFFSSLSDFIPLSYFFLISSIVAITLFIEASCERCLYKASLCLDLPSLLVRPIQQHRLASVNISMTRERTLVRANQSDKAVRCAALIWAWPAQRMQMF